MCIYMCLSQVSLKVLNTRPEPEVNPSEEEVSIRLSILPIRLNIDQVHSPIYGDVVSTTMLVLYAVLYSFCSVLEYALLWI